MSSDSQSFVKQCLERKVRLDKRKLDEARPIFIIYDREKQHAEVYLGETKFFNFCLLLMNHLLL